MNLSEEETILAIQKNPYMQYFVGLSEFTDRPVFDLTLFVTICKLLCITDFNDMSVSLLKILVEKAGIKAKEPLNDKDDFSPCPLFTSDPEIEFTDSQGRLHKGFLKVDATCADAEVRYPTDIDLLHDGCKVINRYIRKLCERFFPVPLTNIYKASRATYLEIIKLKKRSKKVIKTGKF